ncbi:uncharacterized protein CTHT_0074030 [Thermochaetoides thermophila DSM 1495]|uniref:Uncharacterized protein n=1 Tax=Chaetomium thermophilum (strain DSM 1495 / CBS 144.50 / IMI 039719) TaxID=759272 RepID=G0SI05_CHATD|nr:hypothetical protein CTHT_0074030 [Thermochaetoides thermophila DSM 1495]EGS17075.1 hypothetical protein CTHT_0074030 [Thermochaetoides thermophila DSM 1495]
MSTPDKPEPIVLFDLPSKEPCSTWSFNPWKTRLLLNYKGLDYRTDVPNPPDPHSETPYTIPTIRLPNNNYIMDSRRIANALEALYPEPPLHLDSPVLASLETIIPRIIQALAPLFMPRVAYRLLPERSSAYFVETRSKWYGDLLELEKEKGGDVAWRATEEDLKEITRMLKEKPEGPFFLGKVSYADFVWGSVLIFVKRCGEDALEGLLKTTGDESVHLALLEGLKPWTERNDH